MVRLFGALPFSICLGTAFAVQLPRKAASRYSNSSTIQSSTSAASPGDFCCQIFAPAVGLVHWYGNSTINLVNDIEVVEYLRYNNTIVPTATTTTPPATSYYLQGYLGDLGEVPVLPGVPTDLNGPYYGGAYDATVLLTGTEVPYYSSITVAYPTAVMQFGSLMVFSGYLNDAGKCMGTANNPDSTVYDVASVANDWFSTAARIPFIPNSIYDLSSKGVHFTDVNIPGYYFSYVSTQTTTWNQRVIITSIGDEMFSWLGKNSAILSQVPNIMSCSGASAAGAPQVHIRVSFLTSTTSVTSTTNAIYKNKATTTSAAPASKTSTVVAPTTTKESAAPTTKATQIPPSSQVPTQPQPPPSSQTSDGSAEPVPETSVPQPQSPSEKPNTPESSDQQVVPTTARISDKAPEPTTQGNTPDVPSPTEPSPGQDSSGNAASDRPQPPPTQTQGVSSNEPVVKNPKPTTASPEGVSSGNSNPGQTQPAASQVAGVSSAASSQNAPSVNPSSEQSAQPSNAVPVFFGSATATALPSSAYVIESQTLNPGGPAVEVSGTTYSVPAAGNTVIVNGETLPVSTASVSPAPPPTVVAVGDVTATAASSGAFVVGGQTIRPGDSAVEVAGTTYSLQSSGNAFVVNGHTVPASTVPVAASVPAPIAVGQVTATPVASGAFVVADQTIRPGGSAVEVAGTTYSLQASGNTFVVNGQVLPGSTVAASALAPAPIAIGGLTATAISSGVYVVADQTLSHGGAVEIAGTTYSLQPSGDALVVNGKTTPSSNLQTPAAQPAPVVIGGITATPASAGGYVAAGQTLSPGGSAVEIAGTTYSLPASGGNVVVNGATSPIVSAVTVETPAVLFGSVTASSLASGAYAVAGQTLSPGGSAIEVSGTTYSLPASGNTVVINGAPTTFETVSPDAILTIGSQTYTAVAASAEPLVIGSQTLVPGGSAVTVSGTVYSLPPTGTGNIVVDGQTTSFASVASGIAVLSVGSQQLSFTPLSSGVVVASQTLYPGGPAITVNGETLSLPSSGGAVVVKSGTSTKTEGLGDFIWQGIASSTSGLQSSSGRVTTPRSLSDPTPTSSRRLTSASTGDADVSAAGSAAASTTGGASELRERSACHFAALMILVSAIMLW